MRSELNNDTLCSLLCAKQNHNLLCYEYEPSDSGLRSAKQAVLLFKFLVTRPKLVAETMY